jgi:hypothetical protein
MQTVATAKSRCAASMAMVVVVAATLAACGGGGASKASRVQGRSEVTAEPVSSAGANPFTAAVGDDRGGVTPPAGAGGQSGGPPKYSGSTPGLYGGTRDHHSCDAEKLINFLEHNPDKAAAWAQTLGIQPSQIRDYVSRLTAVILRTDTRVTNHGFVNGHANPIQAVLEAGTAVFVDNYGRPVVKCYCGNPLTPPELLTSPTYTGDTWTDFDESHVTFIDRSTTLIYEFTIYDVDTGKLFHRTPGADGQDSQYLGTPAPPPPNTGSSPPPTPAPPSTPETHTNTTPPSSSCPPGEVPDPSSPDGCSPATSTGDTGSQSPGTSTGDATHGTGASGASP